MNLEPSMLLSNFIWLNDWTTKDDEDARIVYFRKNFKMEAIPEHFNIQITADSRYKLYINGSFVQEGPAKGDDQDWYVDTAELANFLKVGENVAVVEVLRYPAKMNLRNHSLYRSEYPCLYVAGEEALQGKSGWKYEKAEHIVLRGEPYNPAPLHILEDASGMENLQGWKVSGYDDSSWQEAKPYGIFEANKAASPFQLIPRAIPLQRHEDCNFTETICVREAGMQQAETLQEQWNQMLMGADTVEISANTTQIVEISAGEEMCGYPILEVSGGAGARITLTPSECYGYPQPPMQTPLGELPSQPKKGDRTDYINGQLSGPEDHYTVGGHGTEEQPEIYEPYWFRTFRYMRIEVTTGEQGVTIQKLRYRSTGYPLDIKTKVQASDESFASIWDICVRTLKRCMHETYVDCPFFEQLQYAMDSRAEILYTYACGDIVTPKGMVHVDWTKDEEGNCRLNYKVPKGII